MSEIVLEVGFAGSDMKWKVIERKANNFEEMCEEQTKDRAVQKAEKYASDRIADRTEVDSGRILVRSHTGVAYTVLNINE